MVSKARLIPGIITGLLFASILYLDGVRDLLLMIFVGSSWTVAVWLILRNRRTFKDAGSGWTLLLMWLTVGVAMLGVHTELPMAEGLSTDIGLLVMGAGWAVAGVGIEMAKASNDHRSSTTPTAD